MSQVYRWRADELDLAITETPFSTSVLPKQWNEHRERRLSAEEEGLLMGRVRRSEMRARVNWRCLIALALETGARLQELILAEWKEFNHETRVWSIPAAHTKSKKARSIPLSKRALLALRVIQLYRNAADPRPFHRFKTPSSASCCFRKLKHEAGIGDFRFHDFRHEAISRMVLHRRQISVYEIMRIVGHSSLEMMNRYANLRAEELVDRFDIRTS